MPASLPPAQLTDVAAKLGRHWPIAAVTAILGLILGVVGAIVIPATYAAQSTVSVNPMNSDPLLSTDSNQTVSMATEQQLARSRNVVEAAAIRLAPRYSFTGQEIQDALVVSSPDQSLVLNIEFTGATPQEAAAGADAVGEAYLAERRVDASAELDRLAASASSRLTELQAGAVDDASGIEERSIQIQVDALANQLAQLSNVDLNPGQIVGAAEDPTTRATPGPIMLGIAGAVLGLLIGIPIALSRKEDTTTIGGIEAMTTIGDHPVLDGTKDTNRADTWDIAALMLQVPHDLRSESFVIMLDADDDPLSIVEPGRELVDALARRGRAAQFVDAGAINEGKISRGWPTVTTRKSWVGSIVVLDTTALTSDAHKVALATRSDSIVLSRNTTDDAAALRRLTGLLRSKNAAVDLAALFPPRSGTLLFTR
ncbi:hypothetical protein [Aeromicrobium sp. CF3.5]|uniref:hypothetical protein n=1 Tax=Aeromicrobium sp. CF3.5 TaxID=3373078 RepID=UPI003EE7C6EF